MVVEVLDVPGLGRVTVEHEPDWSGDALVRCPDGYIARVISIPGPVLRELGRTSRAAA